MIADDGSGDSTREQIERFARALPFPVRHLWQPNQGFRKAVILNRAIAQAVGDYVVFLDGDCIPPARMVATHVRLARRNRYVAGGKVLLGPRSGARLTEETIAGGALERIGPWIWDARRRRRFLARREYSTFRDHLLAVGGFDERFNYGYEDADLGWRLVAIGLGGLSIRFSCPVFHVDHARPYAGDLERTKVLYDENRASGVAATPFGLGDRALSRDDSRA